MSTKKTKREFERLAAEYRNDFPRFKKELKRLLTEGVENKDLYLIGAANYYLGLTCFRQGSRTSILPYAYKAASMLDQTNDYDLISRSHNLLGIGYVALENYQLGLDEYRKTLQIVSRHRSSVSRTTVLNNIAECYYQMGEYRKGIRIMLQCLKYAFDKDPDKGMSISIFGINLSDCYESIGEFAKAEDVLIRIGPSAEPLTTDGLACAWYARRACVAYQAGEPEKGARFADQALEAMKLCGDTYELHRDFEKIAKAAIRYGEYDRAKQFADVLCSYACDSGHTLDEIIAGRVMAEYCDAVGDEAGALTLYRKLNGLYEKRAAEEKAMQYSVQKKSAAMDREVQRLMEKVRVTEENAEREPLTKLLNRTALVKVSTEFAELARAKRKKLGGIFLDIDFFKEFNDTYGHARGDDAIRQVARACLEEETADIRFARYGGDEYFGVVLGKKDEEVAEIAARICERIRREGTENLKTPSGRLTLSVGVVNVDMTDCDSSIIDVVNYADKALYHAKNNGKDAIYVYDRSGDADEQYRRRAF